MFQEASSESSHFKSHVPMIYSLKHSEWHWQIAQDQASKKFALRYKRPTEWSRCPTEFDTAELAADAVINGKTGLPDWDSLKHPAPMPSLGSWLIDPSGESGGGIMPTPITT
jgi:hypothetical protein